jgi:hypothetical protein
MSFSVKNLFAGLYGQ